MSDKLRVECYYTNSPKIHDSMEILFMYPLLLTNNAHINIETSSPNKRWSRKSRKRGEGGREIREQLPQRKPDRDNSDVSKSMDRGLLRNFSAMDQISRIDKLQK